MTAHIVDYVTESDTGGYPAFCSKPRANARAGDGGGAKPLNFGVSAGYRDAATYRQGQVIN